MYQRNKLPINNGIIIGIVTVLIQVLVYYFAPEMMGHFSFGIITMLISLGLYIYFTIQMKKAAGEFWPFKNAVSSIFIMAFIATVLSTVFNYVFYNFIEPNAYAKISGYIIQSLEETYSKIGMSTDDIDEAIEMSSETLKGQYNPGIWDSLRNIVTASILQFIMSLIFGAIFKKSEPIYITVNKED